MWSSLCTSAVMKKYVGSNPQSLSDPGKSQGFSGFLCSTFDWKPWVLPAGVEQGALWGEGLAVGAESRRERERIQAVPRPKQRGKSNFRKWGPLGPPLLKEPGGLLEENDCVREPSPQFKGKAGDSLRQKEKGNLWALAAVGTGAAGWGTGGEESLAQRELAPSLPSTTTFPLPWTCSGWSLVLQPASCSGPGSQVTEDGWAQEKVSKGCHRVFGRLSGSRDQHWQP